MPDTRWTCPVCDTTLQTTDTGLCCHNGHSFDRAREGYINLLLAQHKRSASPGDDRQMLRHRREFLEQGYYRPLAERLAQLCVEQAASASGPHFALLDTGCGEGYYTGRISAALHERASNCEIWVGGIDIAKEAVRMAARRYPNTHFAVASNAALPVAARSMDCIIQIFAPGYDAQVVRALKPDGRFISVTPGPRHLFALRQRVYDRPREHEAAMHPIEGLQHKGREHIEFKLTIEREGDVGRLLSMTPYYWQVDREKQAQINDLPRLDTEVAFVVDCYIKGEPDSG